jgi:hypothetical protein
MLRRMKKDDVLYVKKHRPAGTQLRGDTGAMAGTDKGKGDRYRRARYAAFGYTKGKGFDGDIVLRITFLACIGSGRRAG